MILISHRGNIFGPSEDENSPKLIDKALSLGYDVEIDLFCKLTWANNELFLGHDQPIYPISYSFLAERSKHLWIHCKTLNALNAMTPSGFNYFFHNGDDYTLTSMGYIWTYTGKPLPEFKGIACMPEEKGVDLKNAAGICSDFISLYD